MPPARALHSWPRALGALGVRLATTILLGIGAASCFSADEGLGPPRDRFYFPTGLVISPGGQALYVANSDFDLRYNGGTVQVIDLPAVRRVALDLQKELRGAAGEPEEGEAGGGGMGGGGAGGGGMGGGATGGATTTTVGACGSVGLALNPNPLLNPGPCTALEAAGYIKSSAIIGAFASGAFLVHQPDGPGVRLFVPVRGDPSVTYFEVADDRACAADPGACTPDPRLDCGAGADGRCSGDFRIGENPYESTRALRLPLEPVGITASPDGEAIVVAHQTESAASLIVNRWGEKPILEHVVSGLAAQPIELAPLPQPGVVEACGEDLPEGELLPRLHYQPGFLLTYRAAPEVDLIRYDADAASNPRRPFLSRTAALGIQVNTSGYDSRGAAVDASEREACEQTCREQWGACAGSCLDDRVSCMASCAEIPFRFYIANRTPASLIIGEARTELVQIDRDPQPGEIVCGAERFTSAYESLEIQDTVPLSYGASRVAIGHIIGKDGAPQRRVFAVAFDSRFIFSYDPEARRVDTIIRTGRGPHAVTFDTGQREDGSWYSFMYVGHFTDSYIGVVDLDARSTSTFGSMILALGQPEPPQESR